MHENEILINFVYLPILFKRCIWKNYWCYTS